MKEWINVVVLSFKKSQVLQSYLGGKEEEENMIFHMVKEAQTGNFTLEKHNTFQF